MIDLGLPLEQVEGDQRSLLPEVPGLGSPGDETLAGVVISHSHPDHYGLAHLVDPTVPIYMGTVAKSMLDSASFFLPTAEPFPVTGDLEHGRPLDIGPFTVTPHLMDHSAFEAFAFLIEAGASRLFYSGDFRGHGRKAGTFGRLIEHPPQDIDALILEGTTVGRAPPGPGDVATELEVEARCTELFRETEGLALPFYSAQNIDRLVSVFKAALQSDRSLVMDLYGATVAAATARDTIPQAGWDRVRVYVPQSQRIRVKTSKEFWRVENLGESRIYLEEIASDPSRWVMAVRDSMLPELANAGCLEGASAAWSMWTGYLDRPTSRVRQLLENHGVEMTMIHASGHASVEDLQKLAAAIDASQVVPIHTEHPGSFTDLFDRVTIHPDGEWWTV